MWQAGNLSYLGATCAIVFDNLQSLEYSDSVQAPIVVVRRVSQTGLEDLKEYDM